MAGARNEDALADYAACLSLAFQTLIFCIGRMVAIIAARFISYCRAQFDAVMQSLSTAWVLAGCGWGFSACCSIMLVMK